MPSKKKKYNARFPAGRIKKIMQTDEEVGKVAQAVPVIISRTLELFVESLLTKTMRITLAKSAKTLSTSHMKQCILSESRFDFLKDLVKSLPDSSACDDDNTSGGSAGLSPAAVSPLVGYTGAPLTTSSSEVLSSSSTLPLQTPQDPSPCLLPNREPLVDQDYNTRIHPMTLVTGMCQENSGSGGVIVPGQVNPNFYAESSSLTNRNRGNHLDYNQSTTIATERSSSPSQLVVDEDYDT